MIIVWGGRGLGGGRGEGEVRGGKGRGGGGRGCIYSWNEEVHKCLIHLFFSPPPLLVR